MSRKELTVASLSGSYQGNSGGGFFCCSSERVRFKITEYASDVAFSYPGDSNRTENSVLIPKSQIERALQNPDVIDEKRVGVHVSVVVYEKPSGHSKTGRPVTGESWGPLLGTFSNRESRESREWRRVSLVFDSGTLSLCRIHIEKIINTTSTTVRQSMCFRQICH